jgi:predicted nucleotidyltransferase
VDQNIVITKLREHAPELRARGLVHVRVFGSTARGESSRQSDVDLLVDFDPSKKQTLVSVGNLQSRLSDILEVRVDLSSPEWMREPVRSRALEEAILAF